MKKLIIIFCTIFLCCGCGNNTSTIQQTKTDIYADIPESATNGMWENSYVDIQQENGKYQTRLYLSSVNATGADLIYFTTSLVSYMIDKGIESDFYIVLSDNEYKLNIDGKEFSDIGFPEEWTEFLKDSSDEGKDLLKSVSVDFSNSVDSWIERSFDKYLNDIIK